MLMQPTDVSAANLTVQVTKEINMHRLRLLNLLNKFGSKCSPTAGFASPRSSFPSPLSSANALLQPVRDITSHLPRNKQSRKIASEEEFLVRVKDDPDVFGSFAPLEEEEMEDEGDIKEEKYIQNKPKKKLSTKQYADIIKELIDKKKIKEAIDVVEVRMIKEDRVQPETYIYNLLLGACGRVGYTKKAFMLYNDMKKRGLKMHAGTYTALFNACANSPWPEDGLSRATHLREIMIESQYEPNEPNYHTMIKAFGRCGDLPMAFSLVDEMRSKKMLLKVDTMNFLLQACISDKEAGFRHALLVWRKLLKKDINPDIYTFNLLLRCIRECGIGSIDATKDVIDKITAGNTTRMPVETDKLLTEKSVENGSEQHSNDLLNNNDVEIVATETPQVMIENRPNLLAKVPHMGNIIELNEVTKAQDRLLLVGGLNGYLETMSEYSVEPDIKTFTILLDNIPQATAVEDSLLEMLKRKNLKPDIDFYNMLIKRRACRQDYKGAQAILDILRLDGYKPDLITYGVLALCCKSKAEAAHLLSEMAEHKYRVNIEILGSLLHMACFNMNFYYVVEILETCKQENVEPNKIFMDKLEEFYKCSKHISNDKKDDRSKQKTFQTAYNKFRIQYRSFKEEYGNLVKEEPHPWQQFRETSNTDVRHYKIKEVRFAPVRLSKFRQKQIPVQIVKAHKKPYRHFNKKSNSNNARDSNTEVSVHKQIQDV